MTQVLPEPTFQTEQNEGVQGTDIVAPVTNDDKGSDSDVSPEPLSDSDGEENKEGKYCCLYKVCKVTTDMDDSDVSMDPISDDEEDEEENEDIEGGNNAVGYDIDNLGTLENKNDEHRSPIAGSDERKQDLLQRSTLCKAALYLMDAKMSTRYRERNRGSRLSLFITHIYDSFTFQCIMLGSTILFMALAYYEDPNTEHRDDFLTDNIRLNVLMIEFGCLVTFVLNFCFYLVARGCGICISRSASRDWGSIQVVITHGMLIFIFLLDSVWAYLTNFEHMRFSRPMRGIYLCFALPTIQTELVRMLRCVASLVDLIAVYLAVVVVWSSLGVFMMAGHYKQSSGNNPYFYTFDTSFMAFLSLFQSSTLSTLSEVVFSNSYYGDNPIGSNFYFIPFTMFSVAIVSVLLGSIYEEYAEVRRLETRRCLDNAAACTDAAFTLLSKADLKGIEMENFVEAAKLTSSLPRDIIIAIFQVHAFNGLLDLQNFWKAMMVIDVSSRNHESRLSFCLSRCLPGITFESGPRWNQMRKYLGLASACTVIGNAVFVGLLYREDNRDEWSQLDRIDNIFWCVSILEVGAPLFVMGYKKATGDVIRRMEQVLVLGGTLLAAAAYTLSLYDLVADAETFIGCYRRLRQFRFLAVLARALNMKAQLYTFIGISHTIVQSVAILVIPAYIYAVVGMELYAGKAIVCPHSNDWCELAFDTENPASKKEEMMAEMIDRDTLQLNFDDFHHSLLTTYMISVMGGPPAATFSLYAFSESYSVAVIYFSIMYLVLVFMGMSLVAARVAEDYKEKNAENMQSAKFEKLGSQTGRPRASMRGKRQPKRQTLRLSQFEAVHRDGNKKTLDSASQSSTFELIKKEGLRVAFHLDEALQDQSDFFNTYHSKDGTNLIDFRATLNVHLEDEALKRFQEELSGFHDGSHELSFHPSMNMLRSNRRVGSKDSIGLSGEESKLGSITELMDDGDSSLERSSGNRSDNSFMLKTGSLVETRGSRQMEAPFNLTRPVDLCAVLFLTPRSIGFLFLLQVFIVVIAALIGFYWR